MKQEIIKLKEEKDVGVDAPRCTRIDVELVASIEDLEKNIYCLLEQKSQLVDERDSLLIELKSADESFQRLAKRNKFLEKAVMEEIVMSEKRTQAIEKELQNRNQALEKAVMEMEELVMQENLNAHSQIERLNKRVSILTCDNEDFEARLAAYGPAIVSLKECISSLEKKTQPRHLQASEVIDEMRDPCLVKDEFLVIDGLSDLKELQNRTQAIEKAVVEMEELVVEMEELVMQENFDVHSQLEAALIKIDELKSENMFYRLHIKPKSEISEADQISKCSKRRVTLRDYLYGVSETSQSRQKKVRFCACIRPSTRD